VPPLSASAQSSADRINSADVASPATVFSAGGVNALFIPIE
jgi:hypothetical protein